MLPQTALSLASVLALSAALPQLPVKCPHEKACYIDDGTNPDGNTFVDASDSAVNFGSVHPNEVFEQLLSQCSTVGCSGAKVIVERTAVVEGGHLKDYSVTLSAEGSFNPTKRATRETMVELLKIIGREATEVTEDIYEDPCGTLFCEQKRRPQHHLSQTIHIATLGDDGDDAFLNIYAQVGPTSDGFCSKILWAGNSIGGAISGVTRIESL
ncbi:unnamed protein product [Parascedosporium putredinis]|uniref:Uncharacterized protein n=1 Tax=Parascedosporium putredinis TaxID=1442378 RepID=A0A9P1H0X4_9PEZI|nr:unnamed protein product [Parascedosporium putredinis]CAI7992510.1 unnamed protein product [Parascedosporium putredinis]